MSQCNCNDRTTIICKECSEKGSKIEEEKTVIFDDDMTFGEWLENANRLFDEIISMTKQDPAA